MKDKILLFISLVILISTSMYIGYIYGDYINSHFIEDSLLEKTFFETINNTNCTNLTLEDTAYCLRDSIKPYFKYNETDDNITLTFDELKERGGDCRDWSLLYDKLKPESYHGEIITVKSYKVNNTLYSHDFYVISNEEGYCILDQVSKPLCQKFI